MKQNSKNVGTVREREREREREVTFKPQTKKNLAWFAVLKLYIKCKKEKMNYVEMHNSS